MHEPLVVKMRSRRAFITANKCRAMWRGSLNKKCEISNENKCGVYTYLIPYLQSVSARNHSRFRI